jgi:hypothetical protein
VTTKVEKPKNAVINLALDIGGILLTLVAIFFGLSLDETSVARALIIFFAPVFMGLFVSGVLRFWKL